MQSSRSKSSCTSGKAVRSRSKSIASRNWVLVGKNSLGKDDNTTVPPVLPRKKNKPMRLKSCGSTKSKASCSTRSLSGLTSSRVWVNAGKSSLNKDRITTVLPVLPRKKSKPMRLKSSGSSKSKASCSARSLSGLTSSRVWVNAGKNGLNKEKSTTILPALPRKKLKPMWVKRRGSTKISSRPQPVTGDAWKHKKDQAWSNSRSSSLQDEFDRDIRPSRRSLRMSAGKITKEDDDTYIAVPVRQCCVDNETEYVYFRVEDVCLKRKGVIIPTTSCLGVSKPSSSRPNSRESVGSSSYAKSRDSVASSCWAKTPSLPTKSQYTKPLYTKNNSTVKTCQPWERSVDWNSSLTPGIESQKAARKETPEVLRPKAYTVPPKRSEIRELIEERKKELRHRGSLNPFDNIQISLPMPRRYKRKEQGIGEKDRMLQDMIDSKMRTDAEDHLTFHDYKNKRTVTLSRDADGHYKDARSDLRGRARAVREEA